MPCECNADLVPFARWEKERQPLELGARLLQAPSGALVISNASEGDAGLYRCLVETGGSVKASEEAQLQIVAGKRKRKASLFVVERVVVTLRACLYGGSGFAVSPSAASSRSSPFLGCLSPA